MHIWNVSRTVSIAKYLCCCFVLFGLRRAVSSEMRHSSLNHRPTLYRFCVIFMCIGRGFLMCVSPSHIACPTRIFQPVIGLPCISEPNSLSLFLSFFSSKGKRKNKQKHQPYSSNASTVCAMCISDSYYLGTCFSGPIYFF